MFNKANMLKYGPCHAFRTFFEDKLGQTTVMYRIDSTIAQACVRIDVERHSSSVHAAEAFGQRHRALEL